MSDDRQAQALTDKQVAMILQGHSHLSPQATQEAWDNTDFGDGLAFALLPCDDEEFNKLVEWPIYDRAVMTEAPVPEPTNRDFALAVLDYCQYVGEPENREKITERFIQRFEDLAAYDYGFAWGANDIPLSDMLPTDRSAGVDKFITVNNPTILIAEYQGMDQEGTVATYKLEGFSWTFPLPDRAEEYTMTESGSLHNNGGYVLPLSIAHNILIRRENFNL